MPAAKTKAQNDKTKTTAKRRSMKVNGRETGDNLTKVTVRLNAQTYEKFSELCDTMHLNRGCVIDALLEIYVKRNEMERELQELEKRKFEEIRLGKYNND